MTDTQDAPTERMATERVVAARIAVTEKAYQHDSFRHTPDTDTEAYGGTQPPAGERWTAPSPAGLPTPEPPALPEPEDERPRLDLRELRLRLTAEPAEGRAAGPARVRPVRPRRRQVPGIPWGPIRIWGLGIIAVAAAVALAVSWLPATAEQGPRESTVLGPHPPATMPVRSEVLGR